MLAPCCEEPAPPSGAPTKRSLRPAVPHRGFKRVSPKSRQEAVCARAPHRAVPLRGHRADPMGRRGGGGAARAPQASPQGEKAFAILKSFFQDSIRCTQDLVEKTQDRQKGASRLQVEVYSTYTVHKYVAGVPRS